MADWEKIRIEYITNTNISYRKLAQKYGVNATNIAKKASKEKWVEERNKNASKTLSKTLNAIASQQANRAARLQTVADKLLTKVERLVDDEEELLTDTSTMRDIARVLKDIKDIQMIRSDADLREQEARIDKLRKEAMVEKENKEVKVTIVGDLDEYCQ